MMNVKVKEQKVDSLDFLSRPRKDVGKVKFDVLITGWEELSKGLRRVEGEDRVFSLRAAIAESEPGTHLEATGLMTAGEFLNQLSQPCVTARKRARVSPCPRPPEIEPVYQQSVPW